MATRQVIKIPRVADDQSYPFVIQRGDIIETPRALKVKLQKTEFMGVEIPRGFEVWIPGLTVGSIGGGTSSRPTISIPGWKINEILRTLVIDKLRKR